MRRINELKKVVILFFVLLISLQIIAAQACYPQQELQKVNERIEEIKTALEASRNAENARTAEHEAYRKTEKSFEDALNLVQDKYDAGEITPEQYSALKKVYENEVAKLRKARQLSILQLENVGSGAKISQEVQKLETNRRKQLSQVERKLSDLEYQLRSGGKSESEVSGTLATERQKLLQELSDQLGTSREQLNKEYNLNEIQKLEREINQLEIANNEIKSDTRFKQFFESIESVKETYRVNQNSEARMQAREDLAKKLRQDPELSNKIDGAEVKYRDIRQKAKELVADMNDKAAIKQKIKELAKKTAETPSDVQSWKDLSLLKKHLQNLELGNYNKLSSLRTELGAAQERLTKLPQDSAEYKAVETEYNRILDEISDISNESYLETGDKTLNDLLELVMRQWEYAKTSEQNQYTFNIRGKQLSEALLEFARNLKPGKASAIEFALGGGKTSTVAPVIAEISRLLTGRKALIELPDGKSTDAYNEIGRALTRQGRRVVVIRNTEKPLEILAQIKDADVVLVEFSTRGFIEAMARSTKISPTLREAYRELQLELVKDRTHIQDEAHQGTDIGNRYTLSGGEGEEIGKPLQNDAKLIGDTLVELGFVKKGFVDRSVLSTTAVFKGIFMQARGALFEETALKKISEKLAEKLKQEGFSQENLGEKINDYFKNKEKSKYSNEFSTEQQTRMKDLLEQINNFAEAMNKKPNSEYQPDKLGRKIGLAKNGNPAFNQQVSNPKLALAVEYVGSTYFDKPTNFGSVKTSGGTISSSWLANQYLLLKNSGTYLGMSGTMGKQLQSLVSALKIETKSNSQMNDLIFGRQNAQGEYEGGLLREATGTKTLNEALDISIKEIQKGKEGMFGKSKGQDANGNLVMVVPHEGTTAGEIISKLIKSGIKKTFIEKNGENFILKDSNGNKLRDINSKEAATLMNNGKDIILVMGEAATTGTDVKLNKNIPFVNFASSTNIADTIMQGVKRAGRLAGTNAAEHPDTYMFISGKEVKTGKLTIKEVKEVWDKNQNHESKNSLYDYVSAIVEFHYEKLFVDILYQEGLNPELARIAQELNEAFTSKGRTEQNLNTEHGVSSVEQTLTGKVKGNTEFFKKILNGEEIILEGEYTETGEPKKITSQDVRKFRDSLDSEFKKRLEDLSEEPTKKFEFGEGKESEKQPLLEETLDGLIGLLSQTIPKEALPEFAPGKLSDTFIVKELTENRHNSEQLLSQMEGELGSLTRQNDEVTSRINEYKNGVNGVVQELQNNDLITIRGGIQAGTYTVNKDEDENVWLLNAKGEIISAQTALMIDSALKTSDEIKITRSQQEILSQELQEANENLETVIQAQNEYNKLIAEKERLEQEIFNINNIEATNQAAEALYKIFKEKGLENLILNQADLLNYLSSIPQEERDAIINTGKDLTLNKNQIDKITEKFSKKISQGELLKRQNNEQITTDTTKYRDQIKKYTTQIKTINQELLNTLRLSLAGISQTQLPTLAGTETTSAYELIDLAIKELEKTNLEELVSKLETTEGFELTQEQIILLTELQNQIQTNTKNLELTLSILNELLTQDITSEQREQLSKTYNKAAQSLKQFRELESQTSATRTQINLDLGIEALTQEELESKIKEKQSEIETAQNSIKEFSQLAQEAKTKGDEGAVKAYEDAIKDRQQEITKLEKEIAQLKTKLEISAEISTTKEIPPATELPAIIEPISSREQIPLPEHEELKPETGSAERARKAREQLTQKIDQIIKGMPVPVYAFNQPLESAWGGDLIRISSPKSGVVRVLHLDATGHGSQGAKHKTGLALAIQRLETGATGELKQDLEMYLRALQEEINTIKEEFKEQGLSAEELKDYDPLGTFAVYDYNTETGEVIYSTGGEERNFFQYTEGKVGAALKSRGEKLGEAGIKTDTTNMKPGDVFVIVSDGVTDMFKDGAKRLQKALGKDKFDQLGIKDLKQIIEENAGKSEGEIKQAIMSEYNRIKGFLAPVITELKEQEKTKSLSQLEADQKEAETLRETINVIEGLFDDVSIVVMKAKTAEVSALNIEDSFFTDAVDESIAKGEIPDALPGVRDEDDKDNLRSVIASGEVSVKKLYKELHSRISTDPKLSNEEKQKRLAALNVVFRTTVTWLVAQDEADLELPYVAHDAKHSRTTSTDMSKIVRASPELRVELEKQYGPYYAELVTLLGFLHDVGYATLEEGEHKSIHAPRGGEMVENFLRSQIAASFGLSEKAVSDFVDAITYHGSDKKGKDYKAASLTENPLLLLMRLSDNLDITENRLRAWQRDQFFMRAVYKLWDDEEIKGYEAKIAGLRKELSRTEVKKDIDEHNEQIDALIEKINERVKKINEESVNVITGVRNLLQKLHDERSTEWYQQADENTKIILSKSALMKGLGEILKDRKLEKNQLGTILTLLKKYALNDAKLSDSLSMFGNIIEAIPKMNYESFPHFIGALVIKGVNYQVKNGEMIVSVDIDPEAERLGEQLLGKENVLVGEYQVARTVLAVSSLFFEEGIDEIKGPTERGIKIEIKKIKESKEKIKELKEIEEIQEGIGATKIIMPETEKPILEEEIGIPAEITLEERITERIETDCEGGGSVHCSFNYEKTGVSIDLLNQHVMNEKNKQEIIKAATTVVEWAAGVYNFKKEKPEEAWIKEVTFEGTVVKIVINVEQKNAESIKETLQARLASEKLWDALVRTPNLVVYTNIATREEIIKNIEFQLEKAVLEEKVEEKISRITIPKEEVHNLESILEKIGVTLPELVDRKKPVGYQIKGATKLGQGRFGIAWLVNLDGKQQVIKILDIEDEGALSSLSSETLEGVLANYDFVQEEYLITRQVKGDSRFIQTNGIVRGEQELIDLGNKFISESEELSKLFEDKNALREKLKNREISAKDVSKQQKQAEFFKKKGEYLINLAKQGSGFIATISDYYEGEDFDAMRKSQKTISRKQFSELKRFLTQALNDLHNGKTLDRLLITHGDTKPANVMLLKNGKFLILDFGVAKLHKPEKQQNPIEKDDLRKGVFLDNVRYYETTNRARTMQDFSEVSDQEFEQWYLGELTELLKGFKEVNVEHDFLETEVGKFKQDYKKLIETIKQNTIETFKNKAIKEGRLTLEQHEELLRKAQQSLEQHEELLRKAQQSLEQIPLPEHEELRPEKELPAEVLTPAEVLMNELTKAESKPSIGYPDIEDIVIQEGVDVCS
ncbi:SpoIIE family protein phosphatase [Candidatus Woesearchaeota archaeon]|nr:SpoIIE family protein phosphatase [Candidatus Woesearchaeota archaeon]